MTLICTSCGKRVESEESWVRFKCPSCGKVEILRCQKCRKIENSYKCSKCGFVGP